MTVRKDWIKVGDKVEMLDKHGRVKGERLVGYGVEPNVRWLCVGSLGTVTAIHEGYSSHGCPDHRSYPDCVCSDETGFVSAFPDFASVAWVAEDGTIMTGMHSINRENEGETWRKHE
jgi:hypothetical protein